MGHRRSTWRLLVVVSAVGAMVGLGLVPAAAVPVRPSASPTSSYEKAMAISRDLRQTDARITRVYGQLVKALGPVARQNLLDEERAWRRNRDRHCDFMAMASMADYAACLASAGSQRLKVLERQLQVAQTLTRQPFSGRFQADAGRITLEVTQQGDTVKGTYTVVGGPPTHRVEQVTFSGTLLDNVVQFHWGPSGWNHFGNGTLRRVGNGLEIRTVITRRDPQAMWSFPDGEPVALVRTAPRTGNSTSLPHSHN